jgi:hypothetical protein
MTAPYTRNCLRFRSAGPASDPWSLASGRLRQVSRGAAEPGVGGVGIDVAVEHLKGRSELWWGLGLVGGQQRAEQPVVDLGVEHRNPQAVGVST